MPLAVSTQFAFAWRYLLRISWLGLPPEDALASGRQALSAFEALRASQPSNLARSAAFSPWSRDYRWLAGNVLRQSVGSQNISDAFTLTERMRARGLLDALHTRSATSQLNEQQKALRKQIADLNRALLTNSQPASSESILRELAAVERREIAAGSRLSEVVYRGATLSALQELLADDEMMLRFVVDYAHNPYEMGAPGAWLMAVTHSKSHAIPLPGKRYLSGASALFQGFREQTTGFGGAAHVAFKKTIAPILADRDLADGIKHLIIVPDTPLNTFPFASLSTQPKFGSLAQKYSLTLTPSAATWVHCRSTKPLASARGVLVLSNPDLGDSVNTRSPISVWRNSEPVMLIDLPATAAEAQHIQRLWPDSDTWQGPASSESAFKTAALNHYGIIHIAAHAVLDDQHTERSALVLAAGGEGEDGLLQAREIAGVPLQGQLIVLASCQGAAGADVAGEGVLSLARAFLASGAGAVVGSLWPIRDDHAAIFFGYFYTALAEGDVVAEALHSAQLRMQADGMPLAAWSGYVVIGDGAWQGDKVLSSAQIAWYFWLVLCVIVLLPVLLGVMKVGSRVDD